MIAMAEPEPIPDPPPEFTPPGLTPSEVTSPEVTSPEVTPLDEPTACRTCREPIARTVLGWMHLDRRHTPTTWLCVGHMRLAEPDLIGPAGNDLVHREHTSAPPAPRRRPTTIPSLTARHRAGASPPTRPAPPAEWPPPPGDTPWWERR